MIRKATLLVAFGLLVASAAMAGVPSPANCHFNAFIDVVATNGTTIDPFGTYTVEVNDAGDLPIEGSVVTINFAGATDIRLCTDFVPDGQTNYCNYVSAVTNASGIATFIVAGAANNSGGSAGGYFDDVVVRADSYLLGTITATCYDQNGRIPGGEGVTGTDASMLSTDLGVFGGVDNAGYKGRDDYSHEGWLTGVDASFFSTLSGYGTSSVGCTYCP